MSAKAQSKRLQISNTKSFTKLLAAETQKNDLPALIFFYGDDVRLADSLYQMYGKTVGQKFPSPEEIHINGAEADLPNLHAELCTMPLFNNQRILYLRHADNMFETAAKKKDEAGRKSINNFIEDFASLPESIYAFFHFDKKKIAAAFSDISEKAWQIEQLDLREKDLPLYIKTKAEHAGYALQTGADLLLIEKCGYDIKQSIRELDNLFGYCLKEKKISLADVEEFCTDMEGDLHFVILDLVAERKINKAIDKLEQNRVKKSRQLYYALAQLFSNAMRYRHLRALGKSKQEIHAQLGYPTHTDFIVNKNERRLQLLTKLYSQEEISHILAYSLQLDQRLNENSAAEAQKKLLSIFLFFLQSPTEVSLQTSLF